MEWKPWIDVGFSVQCLPFICTLAWSSSMWNECQKEKSVHGSSFFIFNWYFYTQEGFHRHLAENNLLCSGCLWGADEEPWSHTSIWRGRKGSVQVPACGTWVSLSFIVQTFWGRREKERRTNWLMFEILFMMRKARLCAWGIGNDWWSTWAWQYLLLFFF